MEKTIHNIILSVIFSIITWYIVNLYVVQIALKEFIIIEILMAFVQIFSNFVRVKVGLLDEKKSH